MKINYESWSFFRLIDNEFSIFIAFLRVKMSKFGLILFPNKKRWLPYENCIWNGMFNTMFWKTISERIILTTLSGHNITIRSLILTCNSRPTEKYRKTYKIKTTYDRSKEKSLWRVIYQKEIFVAENGKFIGW